jgi:hypothetical protein
MSQDKYRNTPVKELTLKDFDTSGSGLKLKKNSKPGLIVFYYAWCGFCTQMKEEYIKLAKDKKYFIGAVHGLNESGGNTKLFEIMKIQGVPNIHYVTKTGSVSPDTYLGNRIKDDMLKYIESKGSMSGGKRKVIRKPVRKTTKKPVRKTTRKKVVGKVVRKPVRKPVRKTTKKRVIRKKK